LIRAGLDELPRLAAANKPDEFFRRGVSPPAGQLGERLDVPASAITESVVDEKLRPRRVSDETLKSLRELFQTCNQARYAPQRSSHELASAGAKIEAALRQLQRLNLMKTRCSDEARNPERGTGQNARRFAPYGSRLLRLLSLAIITSALAHADDVSSGFDQANKLYEQASLPRPPRRMKGFFRAARRPPRSTSTSATRCSNPGKPVGRF